MKEMLNGMKQSQMDKYLMVIVLMVIKVQFQEYVFNPTRMEFGVLFLVLVMVLVIIITLK